MSVRGVLGCACESDCSSCGYTSRYRELFIMRRYSLVRAELLGFAVHDGIVYDSRASCGSLSSSVVQWPTKACPIGSARPFLAPLHTHTHTHITYTEPRGHYFSRRLASLLTRALSSQPRFYCCLISIVITIPNSSSVYNRKRPDRNRRNGERERRRTKTIDDDISERVQTSNCPFLLDRQ